ncbi:hypothetical protein HN51_022072 [Arachis hypogaea]|uniref:At4g14310 8-bladed propeller domain-containing protein n=1 Tax=Arachis hypogaea TaxID=3818 RepID=A0A445EDD3_ARAHY|nr:KIN14B-interacting protein At4g14310 [Arachis hypogaea]QHO53204.1 uncharacterized protein DS421_2g45840 [Arachis hypogaea]RYR73522.1 hypothetical protein Ahy_A02g007899 [Arachis hypogaea]
MSTRRVKDRDGGDPTAATLRRSSRSVTPPLSASRKARSHDASAMTKLSSSASVKFCSSAEKENRQQLRRSTSHGSEKPTIRAVPRVDKAAITAAASRDSVVRRSTTSVPRGRSSSRFEFNRISSDSHETRKMHLDRANPTREPGGSFRSAEKVTSLTGKGSGEKSASKIVGGKVQREKYSILKDGSKVSEESSGCNSGKSSSRLHEKLAFLEGKVKRIASDIKKTKELLDMNNPDASKVILSDIQEKISGIEKAMVHVTGADSGKVGSYSNGNVENICKGESENDESKRLGDGKSLIKGLKTEELEDRLFPHHKLIKNRILLKESWSSSSESCLGNGSDDVKAKVENNKVLSPVCENSIAVEFLASLNNDKEISVGGGGGGGGVRCCEVQETEGGRNAMKGSSSGLNQRSDNIDMLLESDEKLEEFDDQENKQEAFVGDEMDEAFNYKLNEIGDKNATGGWFVSEGEAVILAHDDGSCSYYDIANCEEKAVYMPPPEVSPNMWRDCWVVRAPGSDGCSGRFVVAASAGNTIDSGFCSWDFYTKEVQAFQTEVGTASSRTALRPLSNNVVQRRSSAFGNLAAEAKQCWYKPCGPLIISTTSSQRAVKVFDVRDGEQIMKWDVQRPVLAMEYSSPLQWRNRGKVVVAESESISLWDVNSLNPQALLSISVGGQKVSALHVSNTDAEMGGGVRKRVSSSEAEGNDGVFCTSDSINILDFRQPSGIGLKISKHGISAQSVFSRGDSVLLGCTSSNAMGKKQSSYMLQQFSLRKQGLFHTYAFPESNTHSHYAAITQVWGNSDFVMGICGLGLHVFDTLKDDDALKIFNMDSSNSQTFREIIGPDDLYCPSFDYIGSRALLISRDRPAIWRHLIV